MANLQKAVTATEASNNALNLIVSKALGYPKVGTHQGGGIHVSMPNTWDGTGATPPGWTKQQVANYVASAIDSALPITDALAAQLQGAPAQALLSAAEQLTLSTAIAARVTVDLDAGGYVPKASVASASAEAAGK